MEITILTGSSQTWLPLVDDLMALWTFLGCEGDPIAGSSMKTGEGEASVSTLAVFSAGSGQVFFLSVFSVCLSVCLCITDVSLSLYAGNTVVLRSYTSLSSEVSDSSSSSAFFLVLPANLNSSLRLL